MVGSARHPINVDHIPSTIHRAKAHPSQQVPCIVHCGEIQGTQLHLRHKELPVLGRWLGAPRWHGGMVEGSVSENVWEQENLQDVALEVWKMVWSMVL